jgi:hypothetical protein
MESRIQVHDVHQPDSLQALIFFPFIITSSLHHEFCLLLSFNWEPVKVTSNGNEGKKEKKQTNISLAS